MGMVHQSFHVLVDSDETNWQGETDDANADHHGQDSALLGWPLDIGLFVE